MLISSGSLSTRSEGAKAPLQFYRNGLRKLLSTPSPGYVSRRIVALPFLRKPMDVFSAEISSSHPMLL
eukprot:7875427-Prorocentrum_lima.AAC.1